MAGAVDASRGAPGSFLLPTRDGAAVAAGDGAAESDFGARALARAAATDATVGAEGAGVGTAIGSAYTLVFFIVILPVLWGLQHLAHLIQKRHGT